MTREGLVSQDTHKEVRLTDNGRKEAEDLMRRHALSERLLTDILGLSWVDAHAEAHKFEHILSPKVEERLITLLGNPNTCPHGNPIPGMGDGPSPTRGRPLTALEAPGTYRIVRISEDAENDVELMAYIEQRGLKPGVEFVLVEREPFDGPVVVDVGSQRLPIGSRVAEAIFVY
jgi:DtxR family Mn-dependent transcriptional regulator